MVSEVGSFFGLNIFFQKRGLFLFIFWVRVGMMLHQMPPAKGQHHHRGPSLATLIKAASHHHRSLERHDSGQPHPSRPQLPAEVSTQQHRRRDQGESLKTSTPTAGKSAMYLHHLCSLSSTVHYWYPTAGLSVDSERLGVETSLLSGHL